MTQIARQKLIQDALEGKLDRPREVGLPDAQIKTLSIVQRPQLLLDIGTNLIESSHDYDEMEK